MWVRLGRWPGNRTGPGPFRRPWSCSLTGANKPSTPRANRMRRKADRRHRDQRPEVVGLAPVLEGSSREKVVCYPGRRAGLPARRPGHPDRALQMAAEREEVVHREVTSPPLPRSVRLNSRPSCAPAGSSKTGRTGSATWTGMGALPCGTGNGPWRQRPACATWPSPSCAWPGNQYRRSLAPLRAPAGRLRSAENLDKPADRYHQDEPQNYTDKSPGTNEYRSNSFHHAPIVITSICLHGPSPVRLKPGTLASSGGAKVQFIRGLKTPDPPQSCPSRAARQAGLAKRGRQRSA